MMVMREQTKHLYEFGPFCLDANERLLMRDGKVVSLPPKVFDTLLVLVEHRGHILEKDELMKTLWPDSFVEESSLAQNVFLLRKAMGEGNAEERYIETIPRRGYRFVAGVREICGEETETLAATETSIVIERQEENGQQNGLEKTTEALSGPQLNVQAQSEKVLLGKKWLIATLASITIAILAFGLYYSTRKSLPVKNKLAAAFLQMRINKVTSDGRTAFAALSPDGKYLAQVVEQGLQQSLWVRQVATTSNVQIIPLAEVRYRGVTFSPDGNFIYYTAYGRQENLGMLFVVPTLGGTVRKLAEDVDSPVAVAPSGKRLAFERNYPTRRETVLLTINADGSGEKILATRKAPDFFGTDGPAWSPDGKLIACAAGSRAPEGIYSSVVGVSVEDGKEIPLTPHRWNFVGQVAWQSDGQALTVIALQGGASTPTEQVWQIFYPGGGVRRITNDLNGYRGVSLSADACMLATVQTTRISHFYVAPNGDAHRATQITSGSGDYFNEKLGLAWTPDGRIVYGSTAAGNPDIWIMNADGSEQKQLTVAKTPDVFPCVTPDGRYIVFVSERDGGSTIWRLDADGNHLTQLTHGNNDYYPSLSRDGQWVIYSATGQGKTTLWKVPIEGGEPLPVAESSLTRPALSPDGKFFVGHWLDTQTSRSWVSIMPIEGGKPTKLFNFFPLPSSPTARWNADSRALTYISSSDNFTNLWSRSIDGGQPRQLTNFQSDRIFRFAWSPDGKQLAYERGQAISDIILIGDFK